LIGSKNVPKLKAVVFDVDGTLINTPETIFAAYDHVAHAHGLKPSTRDEIMVHMGKSLRDIFIGLYPDEDVDPLIATNSEYITAHMHEAELYAHLLAVLEALRQKGIKLAALTGGNSKVENVLKHHEIHKYFDSIVHSERIVKQKPDPEGLLLALKECGGVPAGNVVLVGDMRYDVLAGKNGGVMATVGLTHGFGTRQELEQAGADFIIDSFAELPEILDTIEQR
jgi:phosphoglycolate phosphatase